MSSGTKDRLNKYGGVQRLISSKDFQISLITGILFTVVTFFLGFNQSLFVELGTKLTRSLVAVIITGIAILVAISEDHFLVELVRTNNLTSILFTFEYTAFLSIATTVVGILVQSFEIGDIGVGYFVIQSEFISGISYTIFNFLFFYTLGATMMLLSKLTTLGDKRATVVTLGPSEETGDDETEENRDNQS